MLQNEYKNLMQECLKNIMNMIKINTKEDPRIAEDFPNDPYSNLTIITQTQDLHLQLAFLTMDSGYFSRIDPDTREVDLRELKEQPLIKVLHSLYGQQLVAASVSELAELYPIIVFLEIEDYRTAIQDEIKSKLDLLDNIQFIEMSYRYKLCWPEVLNWHLENRLKVLEDSKNYLQLSKLENDTFNELLLKFVGSQGEAHGKVLNNVMENYFNRKSIKPIPYLKDPVLAPLQIIWLKHHHVPLSELTPKSSPIITSAPEFTSTSLQQKRKRVLEMQQEISTKDNIIQELNHKIEDLKRELGLKPEIIKPMTARSLLIEVQGDQTRGRRQSKRLEDLLGEGHEDNESIEQKRGSAKNHDIKESKAMHRLGSKNIHKL